MKKSHSLKKYRQEKLTHLSIHEYKAFLILDKNPLVDFFYSRTEGIEYETRYAIPGYRVEALFCEEDDKTIWSFSNYRIEKNNYYPDIFVKYKDGSVDIMEIKHPKYCLVHANNKTYPDAKKFKAAIKICEDKKWRFILWIMNKGIYVVKMDSDDILRFEEI